MSELITVGNHFARRTRNLISRAIDKNDFLSNYMDKERREMVIDAMELVHFARDSFIIQQNEEGSEIFVSNMGQFMVIMDGKTVKIFGEGTVFGELAILYNAKRLASIKGRFPYTQKKRNLLMQCIYYPHKAATDATVWKVDRDLFRQIMMFSGNKEREENLNFLRSAPFLSDLSEDVLNKLVDLLQRVSEYNSSQFVSS